MKTGWKFLLVALLSVCVGAALDEALLAIRNQKVEGRNRNSSQLFQQRLRCKTEADDYARKSSENNSALMLEMVEFSPNRHSCVGEYTRITSGKRLEIWSYETIDILTGEVLYRQDCIMNDPTSNTFCGNGRDLQLRESRDKALHGAVSQE